MHYNDLIDRQRTIAHRAGVALTHVNGVEMSKTFGTTIFDLRVCFLGDPISLKHHIQNLVPGDYPLHEQTLTALLAGAQKLARTIEGILDEVNSQGNNAQGVTDPESSTTRTTPVHTANHNSLKIDISTKERVADSCLDKEFPIQQS